MAYYALDEKSLITFIENRPSMEKIFSTDARLTVETVGDGNLNLIFIVRNEKDPSQEIVLKQALPTMRLDGESWPLTHERMHCETLALKKHYQLAPGLVPEIFDSDEEMSLVIMEYLGEHEIMRKALVARQRFPKFADHISTFLVCSLFYTSDLYLTSVEKKLLMANFVNEQPRKLQENLVYTNPFIASDENNWNPLLEEEVQQVWENAELKMAIAEMKQAYMNSSEALIHTNLHTGSIMLNEDDTRVIDPAFAFFGPMAYDIGAVLQNLVLNYLSHFAHTPDKDERESYQAYLLEMVGEIWIHFARKFNKTWVANNRGELVPATYWDFPDGDAAFAEYRKRYIVRLLQDATGHGGVKLLRRMMGIVIEEDISSIEDPEKRVVVEKAAIRIGTRWLMERGNINSIGALINIVKEESAEIDL